MGGKPESGKWQSEITSLRQGFRKLYETGELSDITFLLKGDAEMKKFKVHKLVLAARSTEFQRLLLNPNVPNPVIIDSETGITETGFRMLLCFIYTDTIDTEEKVPIIEALIAAEYYRQGALQDLCRKKINSWIVTTDNVWQLLNAGLNVLIVKDKCLAFLEINATEALLAYTSYTSFKDISFQCLAAVLESGVLKSVPALYRINKIMEWGVNHYGDFESVRKSFLENKLLHKLTIEELTLEELRLVRKNYKDLLTPEEIVQFMDYSIDKDVSSLPFWYKKASD